MGRVLPEQLVSSPGLQAHRIWETAIRLAKPSRRERLHPISSSSGRVSPSRCSSRASRARDRNSAGLSRKLRAQASSSSRVSMIWAAITSCSSRERDSMRRSALVDWRLREANSRPGPRPLPRMRLGHEAVPADRLVSLQDARNLLRLEVSPFEDPEFRAHQAGVALHPADFTQRPAAAGAGLALVPLHQDGSDQAVFRRRWCRAPDRGTGYASFCRSPARKSGQKGGIGVTQALP